MEEMEDLKKKVANQIKDVSDDVKGQINQLEKTLSDQIGALNLILQEKGEPSKQPQDDGRALNLIVQEKGEPSKQPQPQPQDDGKRTTLGRVFRSLIGGANPPEPAGPNWVEQLALDLNALTDPYNGLELGTDTFPDSPWTPLSETPPKHLSYLPSSSSLVEYDPNKNVSVRPDWAIVEQGKHAYDNFQVLEAQGKDCVVNAKKYIGAMFEESLKAALEDKYEADSDCSVAPITGDYQCYHPMGLLSNLIGRGLDAASLEQAIRASLTDSQIVQSCYVEGPGVNFILSEKWIAKNIQNMLYQGIKLWAPKLLIKKAFVDFSSPQTADDMRLSHFRAAIMGESIARMLQFSGVKVLRSTPVTTCGTQGWKLILPPVWEPLPADTCKELQNIFKLAGVEWREEEGSFYSHKEKIRQDLNVFIPMDAIIPCLPDVLTELTCIWFRLEMQKNQWLNTRFEQLMMRPNKYVGFKLA